ncbi:hypothetical protein ACS0ZG_32580 [Burkholderia gladioli]|nr:hypothetical protein [Burkholderia gladioli]
MKWTWLSLRNPLACSGIVPRAASWWGRTRAARAGEHGEIRQAR